MISVCLPTRGRPQNMRELCWSIIQTAALPTEVVFYIDDDDKASQTELGKLRSGEVGQRLSVVGIVGPRITMSDTYNKCAELARGDILMECCDAVIFKTPGWDEMVEAAFQRVPDRILLVYGDDEIHSGAAATLPFLHRRWVDVVGRFMPPYFSADYCDTWVWEVARMLNRTLYLPEVVTQHRHPAAHTAPMDKTHEERMTRGYLDNVTEIFNSKAAERAAEADKLRTVMP